MNAAEKFLEEFGNIDDEFLEEAMNYTMKKKFNFKPIIAVAVCAALALAIIPVAKNFVNTPALGTTAPTPEKLGGGEFAVLYAGRVDGSVIEKDEHTETDFDGLSESFTDKSKVGTTKTVEIAGNTWTGVYKDSTRSDYYMDDTDNYFVEADGKKITFSINRETGVCTIFYVADANNVSGKKLSEEECYAKAIKHLKNYVVDIEEYELKDVYNTGGKLGYLFRMYRMIDGVKTSDCIDIRVKETGEVYSHALYSIGTMKNIDISSVNLANINKSITEKVNALYNNHRNVTTTQEDLMLSKLADGTYIFECRMGVEVKTEDGEYKDLCKFIVELD